MSDDPASLGFIDAASFRRLAEDERSPTRAPQWLSNQWTFMEPSDRMQALEGLRLYQVLPSDGPRNPPPQMFPYNEASGGDGGATEKTRTGASSEITPAAAQAGLRRSASELTADFDSEARLDTSSAKRARKGTITPQASNTASIHSSEDQTDMNLYDGGDEDDEPVVPRKGKSVSSQFHGRGGKQGRRGRKQREQRWTEKPAEQRTAVEDEIDKILGKESLQELRQLIGVTGDQRWAHLSANEPPRENAEGEALLTPDCDQDVDEEPNRTIITRAAHNIWDREQSPRTRLVDPVRQAAPLSFEHIRDITQKRYATQVQDYQKHIPGTPANEKYTAALLANRNRSRRLTLMRQRAKACDEYKKEYGWNPAKLVFHESFMSDHVSGNEAIQDKAKWRSQLLAQAKYPETCELDVFEVLVPAWRDPKVSLVYHRLSEIQHQKVKSRKGSKNFQKNIRVSTGRVSARIPSEVPWDCCIDGRWLELIGKEMYQKETAEWMTCGDPEGWSDHEATLSADAS